MINQIDEYLTEFLDGRYHLEYLRIGEFSIRYFVKDPEFQWVVHPLLSVSLNNRLNSMGLRLSKIIYNISDAGVEQSVDIHFTFN